jgi:hypothetical protein
MVNNMDFGLKRDVRALNYTFRFALSVPLKHI